MKENLENESFKIVSAKQLHVPGEKIAILASGVFWYESPSLCVSTIVTVLVKKLSSVDFCDVQGFAEKEHQQIIARSAFCYYQLLMALVNEGLELIGIVSRV